MKIVINGGTKGIGREIVCYMAKDPANVLIVTGRSAEKLSELAEKYPNVNTMVTDFSDFDSHAAEYLSFITSVTGSIDIMINVAGYLVNKDFMDISHIEAKMMMATNFFGPASAIRMLKPLMHEGSHIVNISSMGGFLGSSKYKGLSYYSASKAAIACLSECLAVEFAPDGISVNCLALGSVQTEMLEKAFPGYTAPVSAAVMGEYISEFALKGNRVFNGKVLPVAITNP